MKHRSKALALFMAVAAAFALPNSWLGPACVRGEVTASASTGFQISISRSTSAPADRLDRAIIDSFGKWWHPDHTFSGDAANLEMDLDRRVLIEKLADGGFVRHLEISVYQPGERIVMLGGLGPLQSMGVHGALTIELASTPDNTTVNLAYHVSGYSPEGLDRIAPAVNRVLEEQIQRLIEFVEAGE